METSIVLGFLGMTAYFLYLSKDMFNKPQIGINKEIFSWINTKNFGVFLHIITMWIMSAMFGFLAIISNGQTYNNLIDSLSIAFFWMSAGFMILYITFYLIFTIKEHLERFKNTGKRW